MLVPPDSSPDLAHAMSVLAADPTLAAQWGAVARQDVAAWDWNVIAERHLELYAQVLSGRTAAVSDALPAIHAFSARPVAAA
jgi:glycosyltransferase involved in cell wall biosynthesis